jgi:DNA polymerase I-like protein with 3'-5' exonuclease and polymerase domains
LIHLNKIALEENWLTKIIGQIHDSIVFDIVPEEFAHVMKIIRQVMCNDIRDFWPWIIVPLEIEADASEVNGNWYEMNGIAI